MYRKVYAGADADRVYRFAETGISEFLKYALFCFVNEIHLFKRSLKTWNDVLVTFIHSFLLLISSCHPLRI